MIEKKLKKCKGTGKAKGWGCDGNRYIYRYGLCRGCFIMWLLSDAGAETLKKAQLTGCKKAIKQSKKEFIKKKEESKTIKQLTQEARRPFQKLIRIRDHGKMCICCDKPLPFYIGDYDAGHYLKAELYTGLIFHPDNIHGQTVYCNKHSHGNESGYSIGLKNRIGAIAYKNLIESKNSLKMHKWSREKLNEIKKHYNSELRLVEKGLKDVSEVDFTIGIV